MNKFKDCLGRWMCRGRPHVNQGMYRDSPSRAAEGLQFLGHLRSVLDTTVSHIGLVGHVVSYALGLQVAQTTVHLQEHAGNGLVLVKV